MTGASSGIGAAYAQRLAREGYDLVLVARREDRLRDVADRVRAEGRAAEIIVADLANTRDLALVEHRLRAGVDGLINNAGFGLNCRFGDGPIDRFDEMLALDVRSVVRLTHAALAAMVPAGRGTIVNVGSGVVYRHIPNYAVYLGCKAFVTEFTAGLRLDYADSGITFQLVVPGVTRTEFAKVATGIDYSGASSGEAAMTAEDFVDAALLGLDRQEDVSIPAMDDVHLLDSLNEARIAMGRQISSRLPSARYRANSNPVQGKRA